MSEAPIQSYPVRDRLTPFVTRSLLGGSATVESRPHPALPRTRWELYTPGDLRDLGAVFSQGVLHALVTEAAGWQRRPVLGAGAQPCRLWEAAPAPELQFTDDALQLCEAVFELSRRQQGETDKRALSRAVATISGGRWSASGDQLLAYWLISAAWGQLEAAKRAEMVRCLVRAQPLLGLRFGPWVQVPPETDAIDAALAAPTRPWLPWWIAHALRHWRRWSDRIWRGDLDTHVVRRQMQHLWMDAWLDAIERSGWTDLVPPFVDHLRFELRHLSGIGASPDNAPSTTGHIASDRYDAAQLGEGALRHLRQTFNRAREDDRMRAREAWSGFLLVGRRVQRMFASARSVHPVDREPNDDLLIAICGAGVGLCQPPGRSGREASAVTDALLQLDAVGRHIGGHLG